MGLADAAFWEAARSFEALLALEPQNLRALGNYGGARAPAGGLDVPDDVASGGRHFAVPCWLSLLDACPRCAGNTLLAHGKLKKQLMEAVTAAAAPANAAQAAAVAAAQQQLAGEAQELLLLAGAQGGWGAQGQRAPIALLASLGASPHLLAALQAASWLICGAGLYVLVLPPAGRQYKAVLELDSQQAKAFINWGRVLGLRAEMACGQGGRAGRERGEGLQPAVPKHPVSYANPYHPKMSKEQPNKPKKTRKAL